MKAKFLKRTETERGKTIKVTFEVPIDHKEVFNLEKGREYDIEPFERVGEEKTPKDLVGEAIGMLMKAHTKIPSALQGQLDIQGGE